MQRSNFLQGNNTCATKKAQKFYRFTSEAKTKVCIVGTDNPALQTLKL